jgi:predicted ArsR family transcriptional regulator
MPEPLDVHRALADPTRDRLYRYLRLSGRPVSVREMAVRLSLHPNTLRPHLRRLEEAGLVASETSRGATVGRPQALYTATEREDAEGRDYRLLADILAGLLTGRRNRDRAQAQAREWGAFLAGRTLAKPGARRVTGPNLAMLREALAEAGFDPRFRRRNAKVVEISMRDCPFRELLDEHRELVCAVHQGLLEGILAASRPPLTLSSFQPLADRTTCRLTARS